MHEEYEYDVFLSFASEDEKMARPLWEKLTLSGLRVFWADTSLKDKLGESWYTLIQEALEKSRHFMLLWTPSAKSSKFVRREYQSFDSEFAQPPRRLLIPVLGEGVSEKSLPVFLRQLQWYSLDTDEGLSRLIERAGGQLKTVVKENRELHEQVEAFKEEVAALRKRSKETEEKKKPPSILEEKPTPPVKLHWPSAIWGMFATLVVGLLAMQIPQFFKEEVDPWELWPVEVEGVAGITFRLVEPGEFNMGSTRGDPNERPVHVVELSTPFYMGKYEVTRLEWSVVMDTIPNVSDADKRLPKADVSWVEVQLFLDKLNALDSTYRYRLPTEAEWEFAARAGSDTTYFWGDDASQLDLYSVCLDRSSERVGSTLPNDWQLNDMLGNVWEWTADWYGVYDDSVRINPTGPEQGVERVIRGGSFGNEPNNCRNAKRLGRDPLTKSQYLGFRVAAVPINE